MKKHSVPAIFVLAFSLCLLWIAQISAFAQECHIVRLQDERSAVASTVRVSPDILTIKKGSCVVWVNWVTASSTRINFKEDGKRCLDATEAPAGFTSVENCYLTDYLKLGGTSSLRFTQPGTFVYEVEVPDQSKRQSLAGPTSVVSGVPSVRGQIIVQE